MDWNQTYLILSIAAAATVVLAFLIKRVGPGLRALFRLLDQLTGVPENKRLGRKAEPGLFEILAHQNEVLGNQDASIEEMKETLGVIRHEVEFNNGSSVKDAVIRVEENVTRVEKKLDEHLVPPPTPTTTTINVNPAGGTP